MKTDWLTKLLLMGVILLLAMNIIQGPSATVMADEQTIIGKNNNLLNLGDGLVLVQQDRELYLFGIRKTYDHPVDDHTIQMLDATILEP